MLGMNNFQTNSQLKYIAIIFLNYLLEEFIYSKSNNLLLTWEYHNK